jgi:hypothetical protein
MSALAVVVPVCLAFDIYSEAIFWLQNVLNIVAALDFWLQCNTGIIINGKLCTDQHIIVSSLSHIHLRIFLALPYDVFALLLDSPNYRMASQLLRVYSFYHAVRRMVKVLGCHWHAPERMCVVAVGVIFALHIFTCAWCKVADNTLRLGMAEATWVDIAIKNSQMVAFLPFELDADAYDATKLGYEMPECLSTYLLALYFVLGCVTTCGFGDVAPTNEVERIVASVILLLGLIVWSGSFAAFAVLIQELNVNSTALHSRLGHVRDFVEDHSLPEDVQERLLDHAHLAHGRPSLLQIWPSMPSELYVEAKRASIASLIKASRLFLDVEDGIMRALIANLNEISLLPGDVVFQAGDPALAMYFVYQGCCTLVDVPREQIAFKMGPGTVFGEPSLVLDLLEVYTAVADFKPIDGAVPLTVLVVLDRGVAQQLGAEFPSWGNVLDNERGHRIRELMDKVPIEEIRERFDAIAAEELQSASGDGKSISFLGFRLLLHQLSIKFSKVYARELFDSYDTDGSNSIEFSEFMESIHTKLKRAKTKLRAVRALDFDPSSAYPDGPRPLDSSRIASAVSASERSREKAEADVKPAMADAALPPAQRTLAERAYTAAIGISFMRSSVQTTVQAHAKEAGLPFFLSGGGFPPYALDRLTEAEVHPTLPRSLARSPCAAVCALVCSLRIRAHASAWNAGSVRLCVMDREGARLSLLTGARIRVGGSHSSASVGGAGGSFS